MMLVQQAISSPLGTVVTASICSLLCSLATFLFTRKKYMTDITAQQIENNTKQLDFYITLLKDYKSQINTYMKLSENTRLEVLRLRRVIATLVNDVCVAKECSMRQYLDDKTIHDLIDGGKNYGFENNMDVTEDMGT